MTRVRAQVYGLLRDELDEVQRLDNKKRRTWRN
jgi:hypothetical protein